MLLDPDPLPVLVTELPELPIKWVDHLTYELIHVIRLPKTTTLQKLEPGYYYTQNPGTPYMDSVDVLQWVLRNEDYDHCRETCKACRMCCQCECGGDS
jgi:hypothetical protein